MKVLVIYVHPKRDSFCGEILQNVASGLEEGGHKVQIADLYAEGFNPAFTAEDYAQFTGEEMPADILQEQARFDWSEGVVIVSPLWWYQFPAMLKGWIDRVFSMGWAFEDAYSRSETKAIGWRKLLILASAGGKPETYEKYSYKTGIEALWDTAIWGFCGFDNRQTEFFWRVQPHELTRQERQHHMSRALELGRSF